LRTGTNHARAFMRSSVCACVNEKDREKERERESDPMHCPQISTQKFCLPFGLFFVKLS